MASAYQLVSVQGPDASSPGGSFLELPDGTVGVIKLQAFLQLQETLSNFSDGSSRLALPNPGLRGQ